MILWVFVSLYLFVGSLYLVFDGRLRKKKVEHAENAGRHYDLRPLRSTKELVSAASLRLLNEIIHLGPRAQGSRDPALAFGGLLRQPGFDRCKIYWGNMRNLVCEMRYMNMWHVKHY